MARRKGKKSRRAAKKKLPLTIITPALIHLVPTAKMLLENKLDLAAYEGLAIGAGGKFSKDKAMQIAIPYVIGIVAHATIGKKINRYVPSWSPVSF